MYLISICFFFKGGWEKNWEAGATPWDLGGPTPIISHLSETGSLPKGRTLVPGCGTVCTFVPFAAIICQSQRLK